MKPAACIGGCGRDCNDNQGRSRCAQCPGRQQFDLPNSLQPFSMRALLILLTLMLVVYQIVCTYQA